MKLTDGTACLVVAGLLLLLLLLCVCARAHARVFDCCRSEKAQAQMEQHSVVVVDTQEIAAAESSKPGGVPVVGLPVLLERLVPGGAGSTRSIDGSADSPVEAAAALLNAGEPTVRSLAMAI